MLRRTLSFCATRLPWYHRTGVAIVTRNLGSCAYVRATCFSFFVRDISRVKISLYSLLVYRKGQTSAGEIGFWNHEHGKRCRFAFLVRFSLNQFGPPEKKRGLAGQQEILLK